MSGLFVTSKAAVDQHGVFAIEVPPPPAIQATGTGVVGFAGQFAWGPSQELTEPTDFKAALNMFAPPGSNWLHASALAFFGKAWPKLRMVRVLGPTAVKATVMLTAAGPTNIVRLDLKYPGTLGNSVVATVSAATDGDANHFDLKVELTGASGTSTDYFRNLNYSGVGADSTPDFTNTILAGALVKQASGRPSNATYNLASGTDGTVTSAEYVGTAGAPDKGFSLMEADRDIELVCWDDPGNAIRAAVNAGAKAHADLMKDRIAFVYGNSGLSIASAKTDAASYRSTNVVYCDGWYRKFAFDGTKQLVPPGPLAASVCAQLPPSTSPAWKSAFVKAMTREVVELETNRGDAAGSMTTNGIMTLIKEATGGFTFEAGVVTQAAVDPAKKSITRTRMGRYIAKSATESLRESVDAPNVEVNQQDIVGAIDTFLDGLKKAQRRNPNFTVHIKDYRMIPLSNTNTQASIDAGEFEVDADVKTSSAMERIFFGIRYGETVTITAS